MRTVVISVGLSLLLAFLFISVAQAQDRDPLVELLIKKGIITEQEARDLEEEVKEYEAKKPAPGGLLSLKEGKFQIGGVLELEYVDTQDDASISNASPHFQLDKAVLVPQVNISDDIVLKGELTFTSADDKAFAEEIYVTFKDLPLNSWLKAGLDDRFITRSRITETYPLTGTAFWRYENIGLTLGGEPLDWLYWRASLANGNPLGTKQVAEDSSYKITSDKRGTTDTKQAKEWGLGLGLKYETIDFGKIDLLGFYFGDRLSTADKTHLQGITGYGTSTDDTQNRYGGRVTYKLSGLQLVGEYIRANDGKLDRYGWYIEPSYKITLKGREYFNAFTFLARYNELDVDLPHVTGDTETWNRETTTLALITQIKKHVLLKIEYNINDEETGGAEVDNDEFLAQLQVKF